MEITCDDRLKLMSGTLGVSQRTIQRRMRKNGRSFRITREGQRQERAKHLLATTPLSVAEIALAVGFSGPAAFCRAFRRWFATTPLAFRRTASSVMNDGNGPTPPR